MLLRFVGSESVFSHSQLHLTCLQLFSLSPAVKCSGPLTPSSPLLPETGQGLLEPLMKAISSRSCVGCVGRSHLFQCSQDCLILTKDGVNGWGAHCPSCWAQRFECDVGTTCGLCNRLENGLKFAWLSKQAPQLMGPLQCIPHNRCGWASCLCDQADAVRPTVNINSMCSVANLATLSLDLATFQTPLATFSLKST